MRRSVLALSTLLLWPLVALTTDNAPIDLATERAALIELDREFARATARDGLDGWLSFFADDAAIFPPGSPVVTGLERIRQYYAETGFDPRGLSWQPQTGEVSSSGDLGYTYGTWSFERAGDDGALRTSTGKYLSVWRKDENGRWRVAADIGNPDPPKTEPDE